MLKHARVSRTDNNAEEISETEGSRPEAGNRAVAVSGRRIPSGPKPPPLVLMQIEDVPPSSNVDSNAD